MRKLAIVLAFLVSTAAFAQQDKPTGFYVFVTNPGYGHSERSGSYWSGAFGVALQRMFTPHFSGEVTVSRDRQNRGYTLFGPDGTVVENRWLISYSTPVDLTARYHFLTDGAWKPYAGTGVRWVDSRAFFDLTGGVIWQFRPSLGLRFDGKLLLGNQSRFNDTFNASAGLAWRF